MTLNFLLKTLKEETKTDTPNMAGALQRGRMKLKKQNKGRPGSENFNPSTIAYGFCKRLKVAQLAGIKPIWIDPPTPKDSLTMDMGTKIHDIIQGYLWDCGILEGYFRCNICKRKPKIEHEWYDVSPTVCKNFKSHERDVLEFREIPFEDKVYKIKGRSDGIVHINWHNEDQRHVFDIKSIKNRPAGEQYGEQVTYESVSENGPPNYHIIQLQLYMRAHALQQGHMLYVAKSTHQIKSFYFEYEPALLQPYLLDISETLEWAQDIMSGDRFDLPAPCTSSKCKCSTINMPTFNGSKLKVLRRL